MRPFALITGAGLAMLPLSASAQVSDEQAAEIQNAIKGWISENLGSLSPELQIVFERGIEVTPSGNMYRAMIPPAEVIFGDEAVMDLDSITIDLTPREDGWFDVTWTIPDTYELEQRRGPGGNAGDTLTLTVGNQRGQGVWAPELESFMEFDAALHELELTSSDDAGSATMGSIEASGQGTQIEPDVLDYVARISLRDLHFRDDQSGDNGSFGEFGIVARYDSLRVDEYRALTQQANELAHRYPPDAGGEPSEQYLVELGELFRNTSTLLAGGEAEYFLTDLRIDADDTVVTLGDARFRMAIAGLEGERGEFGLHMSFGAVTVEPAPPLAHLVPNLGSLDIAVTEIPNEAFVEALIAALQSVSTMSPETALMMAGTTLQQAAMQAGTTIEFSDVRLVADSYKSVLTGQARTDPGAALGGIVDVTLMMSNLDALISSLEGIPDAADTQAGLTMLQAMGAQDTDDEGNPARRYDFEVTADGKVTLNGADFGPLMENMMR